MPVKTKITVTKDQPLFLGEYEGIGQRKVDLAHVRKLSESFALWQHKPLLLWKDKGGALYVIGGQHRMTALRQFIFPASKLSKMDMDAIVYVTSDVPAGMTSREFLLLLIASDNAGKENSSFDLAQLDHNKAWYRVPKAHGIEFGHGGNTKTLHTECIVRAVTLARGYLETGRFVTKPWLSTFEKDDNEKDIEKAVLYARWWDENVAMPVHKTSSRINLIKPTCLSLMLGMAFDPANAFPDNPDDLTASKAKHRTLLEAPAKLLACSLHDRTKGNACAPVWTGLLEPINSAKKRDTGRIYVGGHEKWT